MIKKNSVFLVTGGGGRLGSVICTELLKLECNVIVAEKNLKKIKSLKKKVSKNNLNKCLFIHKDLTKKFNIKKTIQSGLKKFKKIDGAVHCMYPNSSGWGEKFENLKENNLKLDLFNQLGAAIIFSQQIIKYFTKIKKGKLIHVSSIQGLGAPKFDHYKGLKMSSPIEYSAIKSGIISITRYLSKYYKNKNLNINCISPGGIEDNQPLKFKSRYKSNCNSKGLLNPNDITGTIMFLLSDKSNYINGQNIIIDDGWSL